MASKTRTLLEVTMLLGQLNRLSVLLQPDNGNGRWDALQQWMRDNPKEGKRITEWIAMEPNDALQSVELFLSDRFGMSVEMLSMFDPLGAIRGKVRCAIVSIQELYLERKTQTFVSRE